MGKSDERILIMPITVSKDEAVEKKLDSLRIKIFGMKFGRFEVGDMRDVWVPYGFMKYNFLIERETIFGKRGSLNKKGELEFVFDYNELHPFQYDSADSGEFRLDAVNREKMGGIFLETEVTEQEIREKMEYHIQAKVLRRIYGTDGKITLFDVKNFYRAAVEIKVFYGANENKRYAYLDRYSVNSEHIWGLKYRIGNTRNNLI